MLLPAAIANSRWFLTTMGTGTVAVLLHQLPYQFNGLQIHFAYIFFPQHYHIPHFIVA
jgi:tellurite resistance protein TehA-like permease